MEIRHSKSKDSFYKMKCELEGGEKNCEIKKD